MTLPGTKPERKRGRPKRRKAAIPETGMTDIIELSLRIDGNLKLLYSANDPVNTSEARIKEIADYLNLYWRCVKKTWPDTWTKPPTEQRRTHKAGLIAMTQVMPLLVRDIDVKKPDAERVMLSRLDKVKGIPWEDKSLLDVIKV